MAESYWSAFKLLSLFFKSRQKYDSIRYKFDTNKNNCYSYNLSEYLIIDFVYNSLSDVRP